MDFFTQQDAARKKTSLLVFYFLIAVALIVAVVYLATAVIFLAGQAKMGKPVVPATLWNTQLFLCVAGSTLLLIFLGSIYKIGQLREGGEAVARMLGGRPVDPNTQDLDERVLLNVVAEMAIASGTPVPPVFVLDDQKGINAFAAGFSVKDAVVTVTRGTLETLTRDELQGVIGHEFSHILNGDMRLNIRLMGVLHGILLIALVGYGIFRTLGNVSSGSRDSKKGGAFIIAILMLGAALIVIGFIGVLFGKLIKSAVSRQREFLADASSVQFTRNPSGIAGALKKIGGLVQGSRVQHEHAESASHMFFGNALQASFLHLMDTHPPLEERIKRVDPSFDGTFPRVERLCRTTRDLDRSELDESKQKHMKSIGARSAARTRAEAGATAFAFQPSAAVSSVGTPAPEHVTYAAAIVSALPGKLAEIVRDPLGAVATIYCLLLNEDEETRRIQMKYLADQADRRAYQEAQRILPLAREVSYEARLPLVGMCLPALCNLSQGQYRNFRDTVRQLMQADQRIILFEYALQHMLLRHLTPRFEKTKPSPVEYYSLRPLLSSCAGLLSTLAHIGQRDPAAAAQAFAHGAATIAASDAKLEMFPQEEASLTVLDQALERLAAASPQIKKRVLEACATCIGADGRVTLEEAELLRVIADSLDCPMPPVLATSQ